MDERIWSGAAMRALASLGIAARKAEAGRVAIDAAEIYRRERR